MNVSADTMRLMLIATMVGMALLAAFYLRRREMPREAYLAWGLLALLLPLLGPFLVILYHPGRLRKEYRQARPRRSPSHSFMTANFQRLEQTVHNFLVKLHQD